MSGSLDMRHLPGFWSRANWADDKWAEYQRRRREHGRLNRVEQALHRLLGRLLPEKAWKKREAAQWPSSSGSYDPCEDHINYLIGSGRRGRAERLLERARMYRPEFLR